MTRTMKTLATTCLLAVCALGLVSCGTPTTVKNAKKWMNDHADSYKNWSGTLVYNDGNLKVNVVSGKGSYSKDGYKATFTVSCDWNAEKANWDIAKYNSNEENAIKKGLVITAVGVAYGAVVAAAASYTASQEAAK